MKVILPALLLLTLFGCDSPPAPDTTRAEDSVIVSDSVPVTPSRWKEFPIPELDSILFFTENSGIEQRSHWKEFYQTGDTGVYVYYLLFRKTNTVGFPWDHAGNVITHTHIKPVYGWSQKDTDQVFISLMLNQDLCRVNNVIRIGAEPDELSAELGEPIYREDSSFVFLGSNNIVAQFDMANGKVASLRYAHFDLPDSIFTMDSLARREVISKKLKVIEN